MTISRKRVPDREELKKLFAKLSRSTTGGVPGFVVYKSKAPGPTLAITACTHGNEPSGLAALYYLLEEFRVSQKLIRGTLYLGVNNLEATKRYFSAKSDEERKRTRFVDHNFNRLPENVSELKNDSRSEVRRVRELLPIYQRFDVGLDIHSTSQKSKPMIITGGGRFHKELVRGFPIRDVLSNIDEVQIGLPAFGFYGGGTGSETPVFEIEAGQHEDPTSFGRAITCAVSLLQNLKMIEGESKDVVSEYREYRIFGSVVFPSSDYELVRTFKDFSAVKAGTVFARGKGTRMVADRDCHTFFCPAKGMPKSLKEEQIFLSEPVRIQKIGRE